MWTVCRRWERIIVMKLHGTLLMTDKDDKLVYNAVTSNVVVNPYTDGWL